MWWKAHFIRQLATTSSVVGPRRSCKALPKAKLSPKKGHGHCLVVCCPSDPLQLSESQWNHYIWEVCSANHWDTLETATPAVGVGQQKGANSSPWQRLATHHTTTLQKFNELGYEVLPHLPCSPDLLSTQFHFFKHLDNFLQRKCFHNQQEAGKTSQDFIKSQSTALHYRKKQSNFSLAKMCWL